MKHFVLTRSAYSPDYPIEANRRRLAILSRVTAPAMRAQVERRWTWVVLVDAADPLLSRRMAAFRRAGVEVVSAKGVQTPWAPDASIPDGRMLGDVSGPWQTAVAALAGDDPRILTTRLDDDDALTSDALARVRRASERGVSGLQVWMLPRGYRFHRGRVQAMNHRSNMFATLESPGSPLRVVMDVKHNDLARRWPVRYIDEQPAWLWVRHGDARSGSREARQAAGPVRRLFAVDWAFLELALVSIAGLGPRPAIRSAVNDAQAARLVELARGRTVLELGSWYGLSTVVLAKVARIVHAVDWHRGDPHAGRLDTLPTIWANLDRYHVRDKVVLHVGRSDVVLPLFREASFDFAFHDAYHATDAVTADAALILPLLRPGALLAFHDYRDSRFGVTAAVDALGLPIVSLTGSLVVVQT